MKKFGEYIEEIIKDYTHLFPDGDINNNIEIFLIKNWSDIIQNIESEKLKKALAGSTFVSLEHEILTIKHIDSNAKFIISLEENALFIFLKEEIKQRMNLEIEIKSLKINF